MTVIAPPSLTWPEWTDQLGQVYKPGDLVAYAYLSGKSARLQYGVVEAINRYRKNGEEIRGYGKWDQATRAYLPGDPSCTVRVIPIAKFNGKWTDRKIEYSNGQSALAPGQNSPKTWQLPTNIVKVNVEIEEL